MFRDTPSGTEQRLISDVSELALKIESERALRFNKGKPRPMLVPVEWLEALITVMEKGAQKYGDNNWKKGMPYSEVLNSLERHLIQFKKGENIDPDDGLSTMAKIAVNSLFLVYYQLKGIGNDDR